MGIPHAVELEHAQNIHEGRKVTPPKVERDNNNPVRTPLLSRPDSCSVDLATKLPNSDLNFIVNCWVDSSSHLEEGQEIHQNIPRKIRKLVGKNCPQMSSEAFS